MSDLNCQAAVEGLLFAADTPLPLDRLAGLLPEFTREEIVAALAGLAAAANQPVRGVELVEVAGGYQLRSRAVHAEIIRRLHRAKVVRFSQSALETLAIIAYRQPVTRAEIEQLRGVDCGTVLKNLLERKLARILGKKDVPGRPLVYGTTREFLETFNLKNLASLPSLKEIQELATPPVFEEQAELPLEPDQPSPHAGNAD